HVASTDCTRPLGALYRFSSHASHASASSSFEDRLVQRKVERRKAKVENKVCAAAAGGGRLGAASPQRRYRRSECVPPGAKPSNPGRRPEGKRFRVSAGALALLQLLEQLPGVCRCSFGKLAVQRLFQR